MISRAHPLSHASPQHLFLFKAFRCSQAHLYCGLLFTNVYSFISFTASVPRVASSLLFLIISSVKCSHVPPCTLDCTHSTQVAAFTLIEFFSNLSLSEFECRSQRLHSHEGHVVQCDLNLNLDFSGSTRQHFPWE